MSSNLADLHPIFRPIASAILAEAGERIADVSDGLIRPAVTFRTVSDQATAKAAGLSQINLGWHQFGLALDVAIITKEGSYVKDGTDLRYAIFGEVAMKQGCIWGGSWTHPDWDHAEFHPGFTLAQYIAWLEEHRVVTA